MLVGIGNGVLDEHDPSETQRIVGGIEGTSATDDVLARQFGNYAKKTSNDPSALKAVLLRPRAKPFDSRDLKKVSARVSVVIGDRDFVLPADRLIESFENCELTILKNCDHFATPENFGFIDQLLEFFGAE
jgi:pimeloyl-ACP methyl ester carboxylesterase